MIDVADVFMDGGGLRLAGYEVRTNSIISHLHIYSYDGVSLIKRVSTAARSTVPACPLTLQLGRGFLAHLPKM